MACAPSLLICLYLYLVFYFFYNSISLYMSSEVTVTSLHPPRLCRLAVFSIKPTLLSLHASLTHSPLLRPNAHILRLPFELYSLADVDIIIIMWRPQQSLQHPTTLMPAMAFESEMMYVTLMAKD